MTNVANSMAIRLNCQHTKNQFPAMANILAKTTALSSAGILCVCCSTNAPNQMAMNHILMFNYGITPHCFRFIWGLGAFGFSQMVEPILFNGWRIARGFNALPTKSTRFFSLCFVYACDRFFFLCRWVSLSCVIKYVLNLASTSCSFSAV